MIGAGKPNTIVKALNVNVLRSRRQKYMSLKKDSNHIKPTQLLPQMPRVGL